MELNIQNVSMTYPNGKQALRALLCFMARDQLNLKIFWAMR